MNKRHMNKYTALCFAGFAGAIALAQPPEVPPPVREPICVLKLFRFKVAPAALVICTGELLPKAPETLATDATPAVRTPPLTVVEPV